jgi:hypothetical protein
MPQLLIMPATARTVWAPLLSPNSQILLCSGPLYAIEMYLYSQQAVVQQRRQLQALHPVALTLSPSKL